MTKELNDSNRTIGALTWCLLVGFIPAVFYSIYHLQYGIKHIGLVSFFNSILIGLVLLNNIFYKSVNWHFNLLVFSMSTSILYICYYLGIRGILFIFPVIIGLFFYYPLKFSMYTSITFSIVGLTLANYSLETHIATRAAIPLIITIAFSFLYARTIQQHKIALEQEANLDYLTGIFNRRSISKWLQEKILILQPNSMLGLYFIDIDDFKRINDSYGHAVGDELLVIISQRLQEAVKCTEPGFINLNCKAARLAGDEFVVAIHGITKKTNVKSFGEKFLKRINTPISIDGLTLDIHTSIGVAITQDNTLDPAALLNQADIAMFEAKKQGKNRVGYFNQIMADKLTLKNKLAQAIKNSLDNKLFYLNFMPIYDETSLNIVGAEALIRNDDEAFFGFGPDTFIQVAEEYDLVIDIDLFVIEQCFSYLKEILSSIEQKTFILAINISSLELRNKKFPEQVKNLADKYRIPSKFIEFEITETSLVDYNEHSIALLQSLKDMGYRLSLDDFGTGYTAFNQLQHYPVDTLKIDRSFIWAIEKNNNNKGLMIDVILSLAKLYKLNVVAEGVEEQYQLDYLKALGCAQYQGYLLCKPVDWKTLVNILQTPK